MKNHIKYSTLCQHFAWVDVIWSNHSAQYFHDFQTAGQLEGKATAPGSTEVYTFEIPSMPVDEANRPCVIETYQSAVDIVKDMHTGLIGPLLLCQQNQLVKV